MFRAAVIPPGRSLNVSVQGHLTVDLNRSVLLYLLQGGAHGVGSGDSALWSLHLRSEHHRRSDADPGEDLTASPHPSSLMQGSHADSCAFYLMLSQADSGRCLPLF